MEPFGKSEIMESLYELDDRLAARYGLYTQHEVVIAGGSALLLGDMAGDERKTRDIDVLRHTAEVTEFFSSLNMNDDVNTFLYDFPEGWEHRSQEVEGEWLALKVLIPSPEDLLLVKLESSRPKDIQDAVDMVANGSVDLGIAMKIACDPMELRFSLESEKWKRVEQGLEALEERFMLSFNRDRENR